MELITEKFFLLKKKECSNFPEILILEKKTFFTGL